MVRYLLFFILILVLPGAAADSHINIKDAWIALSPPAVVVNAVYFNLENRSPHDLVLESITSPQFNRIEIHESVIIEGMSSMVHHRSILVPANSMIEMMPGGFHLMLYNEGKTLNTNDRIPVIFGFSDGTKLELELEVRDSQNIGQDNINQSHQNTDKLMSYQKLLPQHLLSDIMYHLTRISWGPVKNLMIKTFINQFNVDMSIAAQPDYNKFPNFNAFFTRQLKPESRPVDTSADIIVSPVDGSVSQLGKISGDDIFQAKGKSYSIGDLLGGDDDLSKKFTNGSFITLYLSPKDYHRIHMPVDGSLMSMTFIPGKLFSVSKASTAQVDNLFAINERLINIFDTELGTMALIMVGAIFVGSMETVWAGEVAPADNRKPTTIDYKGKKIYLARGREMGRFNMGSTVILLFEPGKISYDPELSEDTVVTMGKAIAKIIE